jgi:hypothetical protein
MGGSSLGLASGPRLRCGAESVSSGAGIQDTDSGTAKTYCSFLIPAAIGIGYAVTKRLPSRPIPAHFPSLARQSAGADEKHMRTWLQFGMPHAGADEKHMRTWLQFGMPHDWNGKGCT